MEHFHCLFYDKINTRKVLINKHPVKASTTTTNVKCLHTNITRYVLSFPKKWRIWVSIPVPPACKAGALPFELIPLLVKSVS